MEARASGGLWGLRDRATMLAPGAILGSLLLWAFHGALSGRLFYLRDVSQNHYPMRHLVTERFRAGELPLWDPFHGGGTPLLADPNNLALHPVSVLFAALPFDAAFTASIVLQFVLLACGGYLLARQLPVGRAPATLAAAIFALSGPAASLASMQNVLSAAAWVPIGLWAWLRGLRAGNRWLLTVAAACFAVVLSAAEAASIAAFVLFALALGLTPGSDGRPAPGARRVGASLMLVVGLSGALAAAQLLPAMELLPVSTRGAGFAAEEGMKWSLDPRRLPELLLPRLFGDPTRLAPDAWWGRWAFQGGYPFLLSVYVGAIPLLLAGAAVGPGGAGAPRRRALGASGTLFLLLALGGHGALYRALHAASAAVRQVRYPERFLIAALPALALLAALGLDRLRGHGAAARRLAVVFAAAAAACFVATTIVAAWPPLADRLLAAVASVPSSFLDSGSGAVLRGSVLRSLLWLCVETLVLAVACGVAAAARGRTTAGLPAWGIVTACGISMVLASAPARSTAAPGWLTSESPLAGVVGRGPGAARLHHAPRPERLAVWGTTDELAWGFRFDRFVYALATGRRERVPTVLDAATDRMDLRGPAELGSRLPSLPLEKRLKILSICHAGLYLTYDRLEHPALEPGPVLEGLSQPAARVYTLRSVLPRVRFVTRSRPAAFPGDAALSLADPDFDPGTTVLIQAAGAGEPPADAPPAAGPAAEGARVPAARIETLVDLPERQRFHVRTGERGYLVVSDAHAPGWRAALDGARVPVLRANMLFRAVVVPPGAHEVEMRYLPASVTGGCVISGLGLVAAVGGGWWMRRRGA